MAKSSAPSLFNPLDFEPSRQEAASAALQALGFQEFTKALELLLPLLSGGKIVPGLHLAISACYEGLGQNRQARRSALHECLEFPLNRQARQELARLTGKEGGKFFNLELDQTVRPKKHPSLSLAMIVKNEEQNLAKCLASYRDIVDEMIVVDTGSTDRTVEIAKTFGARVEYFPWIDDFAAARNESLKYASCDWILRTDADETITEPEKIKLLHALNSGVADIYICHTLSTEGGQVRDGENVRLIRNHLGVKYESPLHENIDASVFKLGLNRARTNVYFDHSGYDADDLFDEKIARNARILAKAVAADTGNYFLHLIYGYTLMKRDKNAGLVEYAQALSCLPEDVPVLRYLGEACCLLASDYAARKDFTALEKVFEIIEADFWFEQAMLQFEASLCLYQLGDWIRAKKLLTWALDQKNSSTFSGFFAPETFNREAVLMLLFETSALAGQNEDALRFCRQSGQPADMSAESLRNTARGQMNAREWQPAWHSTLLAGVLTSLTVEDYCNLARCQIQLHNHALAGKGLANAEKTFPDSALIANTQTILAVQENDLPLALEKSVETFILEPGNTFYKANLEKLAQANQLTPVQALKQTGLDWLKADQTKKALYALTLYSKFAPEDAEVKKLLADFSL